MTNITIELDVVRKIQTDESNIIIPEGVKELGFGALHSCCDVVSIHLPSTLEKICVYEFTCCNNLSEITVPFNNLYFRTINGVLFDKQMKELICFPSKCISLYNELNHYSIPYGVQVIGMGSFYNCKDMFTIEIPNTVEDIRASAFEGCSGLSSIELPSSVHKVGSGAFDGCGFSEIYIPEHVLDFRTDSFNNCNNLERIIVSENHPTLCSINGVLFSKDKKTIYRMPIYRLLLNYEIPSFVEVIGFSSYQGCRMDSVVIGSNVKIIEGEAFKDCHQLEYVSLPDTIKEIHSGTFENCARLLDIEIKEGVNSIECEAFKNCYSLDSITFPNSLESISFSAFEGCSKLNSIRFGKNVKTIENGAFCGCYSLKAIYFESKKPSDSIEEEAFISWNYEESYNIDPTNCVVYVPRGGKRAYSVHSAFREFDNIEYF